jgi:hypothetical protein
MSILLQFVYRLAFGLALGMALTPPRWVRSGFYRNQAYVLLGLLVLAACLAWLRGDVRLWPAVAGAATSYAAAVVWLYERPRPGTILLFVVAGLSLCGAWLSPAAAAGAAAPSGDATAARLAVVLAWLDPLAGGLLLGMTMAAMLLGHWYLNAPGMKLAPLRQLLGYLAGSLVLRSVVCGAALAMALGGMGQLSTHVWLFLALRWLAGLAGTAVMAWMTWQTLKIPNTQSATGVLYVAVILTFLGELAGGLLAARFRLPL